MRRPSASAQRTMAARAAMGRPRVERPTIAGTAALDDTMLAERDPAQTPNFGNGRPVEAPAEAPVELPVAEPAPELKLKGPMVKRSGTARAPASGWKSRRSRKPETAAPPPAIAPLVVVDAPEWLPAGDPVRLVRDAEGGLHVDVPVTTSRTGRARWCVDDLVALPHLGMQTLAVAFHLSDGKSVGTWEANVGALRSMAKDVVDAKLSGTPVDDLPADFMDRLQVVSETRRSARLTARQQTDFNRVRVMLAFLPGTGHLDLEHRDVREDGAPQWAMDAEGQPVATPKLGFTDRDIELIAKRASLELRRTVGRWNHLAAFVNGDPVPEGPCSMDELKAAAALLRANETRAVSSRELCEVGSETWHRLHRVGWAAMGELEAEFGDGMDRRLPRSVANAIRVRRLHLDSGGKDHSDFSNTKEYPKLFVYEGWRVAAQLAFPTGQGMIAPMTLLGLQTRFNPGVLANLAETAFQPRHQHWIELDEPVSAIGQDTDAPKRLYAAPYKPRAKRLQPVDFPITGRIDAPAAITDFLRAWTRGLRETADLGVADGKLCIYASVYHGESTVMSYLSSGGTMFRIEFAALCARADAIELPPRALRVMGVDIIHDRTAGDEMMLRAAGNWVPGSSSPRRYLAGPTLGRDRERLFWAILLLSREREHGIAVSGRPMSADLFSATDGFRCRNVMRSPDPLPLGEPCRARGLCAICPHGGLDVGAPAWSFSRIVSLARTIMERLETATPSWARRYRPVLRELLDVWIPLFPDEVVSAARRLPDYPIGELPDVE